MHLSRVGLFLVVALVTGAGVIGVASAGGGQSDDRDRKATAVLRDAAGKAVGRVDFRQSGGTVTVLISARRLTPGFHGFHIHAVGQCQAPGFTTAGGHLKETGQNHPAHRGDLPVLQVRASGRADQRVVTDRFKLRDLRDTDGSAVIVHANPDNYANIPADRYDPDPDQMTLDTGDAGARVACGVVR